MYKILILLIAFIVLGCENIISSQDQARIISGKPDDENVIDEPIYSCPVCGVDMRKSYESKYDIIIDHCPKCLSTFLSREELKKISGE